MTRTRVLQYRLLPTAISLLIAIAAVRLLWFPDAYFALAGIGKLIAILVAVNLIIGPGLTALIYKPGKRGLLADVAVLGAIELVALGWALHAMYVRQPAYVVFAVDRFEVVTRREIDTTRINFEELRDRPGHEPRLVFAELPKDPETFSKLMDQVLFEGQADIDRRTEFWKPYAAGIRELKLRARPLTELLAGNDTRAQRVRRWLTHAAGKVEDYVFLPLRGKNSDAAMIVHADVGYPVAVLTVDPW